MTVPVAERNPQSLLMTKEEFEKKNKTGNYMDDDYNMNDMYKTPNTRKEYAPPPPPPVVSTGAISSSSNGNRADDDNRVMEDESSFLKTVTSTPLGEEEGEEDEPSGVVMMTSTKEMKWNRAPVETPPTSGNIPLMMNHWNHHPEEEKKMSRFHFLSDIRAPKELSMLEEETMRRRNKFRERVTDLHRRLAKLDCELAKERMDRHSSERSSHDNENNTNGIIDRLVYDPLERAAERVMRRLNFSNVTSRLDRKVLHLDSVLMHHIHVSTTHSRFSQLENLRSSVRNQIQPLVLLETTKADKREGGLVRKYEQIAGLSARSFAEENAQRSAILQLLDKQVQQQAQLDEQRTQKFLNKMAEIRSLLRKERDMRVQSDEKILNQIIVTKKNLQRIALESLGET